jgi:hypothetical protein
MAWDAGGGLWWAATAEIFKSMQHLLKHFSDTTPFFRGLLTKKIYVVTPLEMP